jgi:ubiquitin carboxyl-terminal hydrolase 1
VDNIHRKAELWDSPTPVIDAIRELLLGNSPPYRLSCTYLSFPLLDLNKPHSQHSSIRPVNIINALSAPNPNGTRSRLFSSREHQDAQELFQLLSSMIQEEAVTVDNESLKDPGFAAYDRELLPEAVRKREAAKSVFEGLTANRRSCVECGYTEAVMHFPFDNLTLPVPRAVMHHYTFRS